MKEIRPATTAPVPLLSEVHRVFQELGWEFEQVEGQSVLEADFSAYHGRVRLHAQTFEEPRLLSVVSQLDRLIPEASRKKVAELLMRMNLELTVGNFEMDWDEGRVVFRVTNFFPAFGGGEIIANLAHTAVAEMDRLIPMAAILARAEGPRLEMTHIPTLMRRTDLLPIPPAAADKR